MQGTKARRGSMLQPHKNEHAHKYIYLYTLKQCTHKYRLYIYAQYTYIYCIEYAYLLLTYLKLNVGYILPI